MLLWLGTADVGVWLQRGLASIFYNIVQHYLGIGSSHPGAELVLELLSVELCVEFGLSYASLHESLLA